jgi:hypothetical protein
MLSAMGVPLARLRAPSDEAEFEPRNYLSEFSDDGCTFPTQAVGSESGAVRVVIEQRCTLRL